jgi:uncharacterized protein with NRDE domain
MCLIVFAWKLIPQCPLVMAANRDEFFERPTQPASWWKDAPDIYAGRDLQAGGTWLGTDKRGRFAALTNIRNGRSARTEARSRGELVANYLRGDLEAKAYIQTVRETADDYNGFNLLVGDTTSAFWFSNDAEEAERALEPGIYGLSNGALDTPWPKVLRAKAQFASLLCQAAPDDAYFEMLADTTRASDSRLPDTGVSLEWERLLSPICIESPAYGTRASTILRVHASGDSQLVEKVIR